MKPTFPDLIGSPTLMIALGFGSGLAKWAPGTLGSVVGLGLYLSLSLLPVAAYLGLVALAGLLGIWICARAAKVMQQKDPSAIVWDEIVGIWCALIWVPIDPFWLLLAFGLFRCLDIAKPGPIGWLDRRLTGGVGIMADDVVAGILTCLMVHGAMLGVSILAV